MPATSRAFADDIRMSEKAPPVHPSAPPALWLEAARHILRDAYEIAAAWLRRGWLYNQSLRGPITDRLFGTIDDPAPKRLEDADNLLRRRFRFAGEMLEVKEGSPFDAVPPSDAFAWALHGFDWLAALDAAGGEAARKLALRLTGEWLKRNRRYAVPGWLPHVTARRFINLSAHGRFFLTNSDLLWRSKLFVSLRNQARVMARTFTLAPEGLPRLEAAVGLSLAGVALDDGKSLAQGLALLETELAQQFLPDGGHIGRSPETLARAFQLLSMLRQGLESAGKHIPDSLQGCMDRASVMLRFFRMGDGGLAVFNGGGEADAKLIAGLLGRSDIQSRPYAHAPHSAYQRLSGGRTHILLDVGAAPPGAFSATAHAGCLAFEMDHGEQRIVVNCGAPGMGIGPSDESWNAALRATAAHSAVVLADTSSAFVLPQGFLRRQLGARLIEGPTRIETERRETAEGTLATGMHDGYAARFGIMHERRLALSPKGLTLTGLDRLDPLPTHKGRGRKKRNALPFVIRFHIHPDVRLSLAQGGGSVILKLPNGAGWRFRCGGGTLTIEESVYLGGGQVRRAEQLVVTGQVKDEAVECAWLFEQMSGAS